MTPYQNCRTAYAAVASLMLDEFHLAAERIVDRKGHVFPGV
jgi:hypothetical protein